MLKNVLKLYTACSLKHLNFSILLYNIQRNCKCNFAYYKKEGKTIEWQKLSEKNLTPVTDDDSWDAPKIKSVGDIDHDLRLSKFNRRHDVDFYLRLIKNAAKEGDTEKMLSVFLHDMLIRDRVMPNRRLVNILLFNLTNLGGHSEAAFRILNKIKEINLEPNHVTYSLVFKNCAREIGQHNLNFNIHNKGISLLSNEELVQLQLPANRAFHLWQKMSEKENYFDKAATNSLLLALNRAGMLKESCMVLDKFINQGNAVDDYTLSAMLEGCLTDRVNGLGLALTFYNKLVNQARCSISPFVITTLMKVVEKCQFGSASLIQNVLNSSTANNQPFLEVYHSTGSDRALVAASGSVIHCARPDYNTVIKDTVNTYGIQLDHFIDSRWSPTDVLIYVLKSPTNMLQKKFYNYFDPTWLQGHLTPAEKFTCIGGIFGVLSLMSQYTIRPNIQTITSFVKCLPYGRTEHRDYPRDDLFLVILEKVSNHLQLHEDRAFTNAVMKRKIQLKLNVAESVIIADKFDPYSWSIQAKHCKSGQDFKNFLILLHEHKIVPNKEMFFSAFTSVVGWGARLFVLTKMQEWEMVPDRGMLVFMENEIAKMRDKMEGMGDDEEDRNRKERFHQFQKRYSSWLDQLQIEAVNTGDRKIFVDDLPSEYKAR